ncbi:hypothetical protein NEOLEDRAFT_1245620, partial [Neolentinus lepideus HHB14362 ss-1]
RTSGLVTLRPRLVFSPSALVSSSHPPLSSRLRPPCIRVLASSSPNPAFSYRLLFSYPSFSSRLHLILRSRLVFTHLRSPVLYSLTFAHPSCIHKFSPSRNNPNEIQHSLVHIPLPALPRHARLLILAGTYRCRQVSARGRRRWRGWWWWGIVRTRTPPPASPSSSSSSGGATCAWLYGGRSRGGWGRC